MEKLITKYQKKLDGTNFSPMSKDLKKYSDEDLRKIYTQIVKDLQNV